MLNIKIAVIYDFIKYFGTKQVEEKALKSGFIKRNDAKLQAVTLLKAFTIGLWGISDVSLSKMAQVCENIQEGLVYTKQALHQKLKPGSELLKEMFKAAMDFTVRKAANVYGSGILSNFKNIYICDGTSICFPDKLKKDFGGYEGVHRDKKAFLKIQTIYNLATRGFSDIQVRKAVENDKSYLRDVLGILKKGDLIVYDLGFFSTDIFDKVASAGSYYLSKVQSKTIFYSDMEISDKKPMPIKDILKKSSGIVELNVCIGQKRRKRIPVRLLAVKLPDHIANERIRKASKRVPKSKGSLNDHQRMILAWNIVITNVPEDMLSPIDALNLYKIRWQIEIMYKVWKSHIGLASVGLGGKAQQECMLYGRLIVVTLMTTIYSQFYQLMLCSRNQELSLLKFISLLRLNAPIVLSAINIGGKAIIPLLDLFSKTALKSLYDKRSRRTTLQLLGDHWNLALENCG